MKRLRNSLKVVTRVWDKLTVDLEEKGIMFLSRRKNLFFCFWRFTFNSSTSPGNFQFLQESTGKKEL